jgi:hypothetical protein
MQYRPTCKTLHFTFSNEINSFLMASISSTTSWPPESLCTIVVPASDTVCNSHASIKICSPAALVWETLRDTSHYPDWNTWVPRITITSQPNQPSTSSPSHILQEGTRFTLHVVMDASKPSKITDTPQRLTDVSTPEKQSDYVPAALLQDPTFTSDLSKVYRIAWATEGGFVARGLKTERFHEIIVLGEEECEVRTWECLGGLLARTVKWFYGETLMDKFGVWVKDLKNECEKKFAKVSENGTRCRMEVGKEEHPIGQHDY